MAREFFVNASNVELGTINHNIATGDFTYCAWIRYNAAATSYQAFGGNGSFEPAFYTRVSSGNWGAYWDSNILSGNTLVVGRIYHLLVQRSGTTIKFFQDGKQTPLTGTRSDSMPNGTFQIGNQGTSSFSARSDVGDIGFWNAALSPDEIRDLARGKATKFVRPSNLIFSIDFDGFGIVDMSGNGHTLSSENNTRLKPVFYPRLPSKPIIKPFYTLLEEAVGSTPVNRVFNVRHDIAEIVNREFNVRHDISENVGRAFNVRHDISELVNRQFNIRHDISELVGRAFNVRHDLAGIVNRTFNLRHDLAGIVNRGFNIRHDISEFVSRQFNIRHDISELVNRTFNIRHDLAGAVNRIFNVRHDIAELVNRSFNVRHDILVLVNREFNIRHDISEFVNRTFNLRHDLAGAVNRSFNIRHDIAVFVSRQFNIRHDISEFVNRTFNVRHDISELVGRIFNLRHDLAGTVSRIFNIRHDILSAAIVTGVPVDSVIFDRGADSILLNRSVDSVIISKQ